MAELLTPQLLVVGGGPGGYVAAIRAGQLGIDTVLVEAGPLGGTCLTRGCIPSKSLIHAAGEFAALSEKLGAGRFGIRLEGPPSLDFAETMRWKDSVVARLSGGVGSLLKRAKVRVVQGWAEFTDAKTCRIAGADGEVHIQARHVLLANGSIASAIPALPFGGNILSSTEALSLAALPRRLAVVGAGYIGLELGIAFAKLGVELTILEAQQRILPLYDAELTKPVRTWLSTHGVTVELGVSVEGYQDGVVKARRGDEMLAIPADKVLVTTGRRPNLQGWGFERMGVGLEGGFIKVDAQCRTSMRDVWAIGDLVGEPLLAHKASAQGEMVAELIAGHRRSFAPRAIAAVCFTEPEIVTVGLSPEQAAQIGLRHVVAKFPFSASGRALSVDAVEGFVRIVARESDHLVLGIQAVGGLIAELAGEFALALEMNATLEDIAGTIHVHPTLSEAVMESYLRALGHAIHI